MGAQTIGLILAGGLSRRMGSEKAVIELAGKPLIQWIVERAASQVDELLISANRDPERFEIFGREVIADRVPGYLGPLAGIFSGLEWMKENRPKAEWLATFAVDTPFFPKDCVARLIDKARSNRALIAVARSGRRRHPIFAVWSAEIGETAHSVLIENEYRKVEEFVDHLSRVEVEFANTPFDPFFNINTQADLDRAEAYMAQAKPLP